MTNVYDCLIIGGGPSGLAAALYGGRDGYKTVVLEKFYPGGQINLTDRIENYPGYENISGPDLVAHMFGQATTFGAEIKTSSEVKSIEKLSDGNIKVTAGRKNIEYIAKSVILAPGSDYRNLGVQGEEKFRGTGVSYCGTCDAPFFKDKEVVAIGGGNTAVEEALHLAKFASKVTLVHRRDEFRATKVLADELRAYAAKEDSNLVVKYDTIVESITGTDKVDSVKMKNVKTDQTEDYSCDGVFVFVGMVPNTSFLKDTDIDLNDAGFIKCEPSGLRTSMEGVFVAGDCRCGAAMQLATAVGDGVFAAMMMKQYLRDRTWWQTPFNGMLQM